MDKLFERLNLYDILAMFIPGSIVLMGLGLFGPICRYAQKWSFIANYGTEGYEFWTATTVILSFVIAYLIGIIIQVLNVWIWGCSAKKLNNQFVKCYINKRIIPYDREILINLVTPVEDKKDKLGIYYEAYNYAIVFHPHTAILTLEKQIALLRNMLLAIIPLCLALLPFTWYWNLVCWIGITLLLSGIIIARMCKVVTLVFEEYEAVKQLKLDEKYSK
jgi:hypothetical protein